MDSEKLNGMTEDQLLDVAFDCYLDGNDELLQRVEVRLHELWGERDGEAQSEA